MTELDLRIINVLKKSTLFQAVQAVLDEEIIETIAMKTLELLKETEDDFNTKQNVVSDFLWEFLESKDIEIEISESDAIANVIVWIYEEYKVQDDMTYKKIMNIKAIDNSHLVHAEGSESTDD